MAICGLLKSRNLLARKRLQKRKAVRSVLLESLEARQLLAVGPQLLGIQPNASDLLESGEVLNVSPREFVFRFDDGAGIDPSTLDGIRIIRSGDDGVFERASVATDFGSGGQTQVEFFAQTPGEAGNGIAILFTTASRTDTRAPAVTVSERTITVELNSNPALETRVEDLLQAFEPGAQTPQGALVYALRLRGSQTIGIANSVDTSQPLVLSGANAAKAATNFNLSNSLEVRFNARDSGNSGLGITISVTARDRGGAGNPIVTVVGKAINVEINSNDRFPTTVQEFVDALNASDSLSSSLIEAKLTSGIGATRLGASPVTYSPIRLTGVSDIEVLPAYVGLGDTDREVVFRLAEALPDDRYRIQVIGTGERALRNVNGEAFNSGVSVSVPFGLDLGALIESIVPQPVARNAAGQLQQARNQIDLYLNDDDLIDLSTIVSVNGIPFAEFRELRQPLFLQNSDTVTFLPGAVGSQSALDPAFYQLFHTADSLDSTDDARFLPSSVRYYPDADRVNLGFSRNLDELTDPNTGAVLSPSELRLRVGTNEATPLPPVTLDATTVDPADTFAGATDLSTTWTPGAGGTQSILINSEINNTSPLLLDFPGDSQEPGNRENNRYQDNLRLTADSVDGTSVFFYNFQRNLGVFTNSNLLNAITEQQKERVREVLSLYEQYLGVRFVESESLGLTIAVGDMRAIVPFEDVIGSGNPGVIELNGPGGTTYEAGTLRSNDQLATVLDIQDFSDSTLSEFAGPFQRAAMQAVGRLLGLGLADEVAALTIQSFDAVFAPGVGTEIVLPGDADIVHGQFLYRPDSKDIDLYQFSVPVDGRITIEAFAERMSQASLLDSQIRLYQDNGQGGWDEIATNDDYYSSDSFLELELRQGNYIVGVSASGNSTYDPTISDTGIGGRSEGSYQLRLDFQPPAQGVLRDGTGVPVDGDSNGVPGGVRNFWFRASGPTNTRFVDKAAPAGGNGSIAAPYSSIGTALAAAQPGDVVRIVGNAGADGDFSTTADNLAYEIGFDSLGRPLPDGQTFDVPRDVSVMIDAGAILKMRRSRIGVGSTSANVDRSGGSLLVLGTPVLLDATGALITNSAGENIPGSVYLTSVNDAGLGQNANTNVVGSTPGAGDWGGIDFRNRVDASVAARTNQEELGQFLNSVSHADMRYGGGQVVVDGVSQSVTPIQMVDSRPFIGFSTITSSANAAMSATPNSFLETNFQSPGEQAGGLFSVDYDRAGPDIRQNQVTGNSINGLQVRVRTPAGTQLEKMTVQGRFDDTGIVHYIPENLDIAGSPGGVVLANEGPSSTTVTLTEQVGGTLPAFSLFNYRFTTVDSSGVESTASEPTTSVFTFGSGSIVLSNLPIGINRIYRSAPNGQGPYELVASFSSNTTVFIDNGGSLGGILSDDLERYESRIDARLAVDPGTIIKSQGARIDVDFGAQLIAEGVDGLPVVFTSLLDDRYGAGGTFDTANRAGAQDAVPGDWGGIYVGHTSKASLDYSVVAYGGGTTRVQGGFSDFNAIEVHQSDARVAHSRIENNATGAETSTDADRGGRGTNAAAAIFIRGAQPIIVDNIIANNSGPAISANVSALNYLSVSDSGRSTGRSDRFEAAVNNSGPLIASNRLEGNGINGLVVRGGNLTTEGHWDDTGIVHVVQDEIVVPDHQHFGGLRLTSSAEQSLVVKLDGGTAGFTATGNPIDNVKRIGGSIQIVGQPGFPVVLTSLSDSSVGAGFTVSGLVQSDTMPGSSAAAPGDWRSVLLDTYSNDRNVAIVSEAESPLSTSPAANNSPSSAQFLGNIAPEEAAGDENLRLGFEIQGRLSNPGDLDVYSFRADAGTEIWLDIDRTDNSLDSVVELVDANGRTLALSDSSLAEESDPSLLYASADMPPQSVNPLRKSSPEFYYESAQGVPKDLYTTNPQDAGMRVRLPGEPGSNNLYHVRVRSSSLQAGDPASDLIDPAKVSNGLTKGDYRLQLRLGEVDEIPGSSVTYADLRFASTGIELVGVPGNSPLLGENSEVEIDSNGNQNDTFANAQSLGNLLETNRQAISVAGNIDDFTDVDWFSFDIQYTAITPTALRQYFSTIIDVDYADGIGRADTSLYVFDSNGNLILGGLGSSLVDDQESPVSAANSSDLSRGSAGQLDPYIGSYELAAGTYFLAVTNSDMVPAVLAAYTDPNFADPEMRLQPIEGVRLIAEDHIGFQGGSTALPPVTPILFPNESIVDYDLNDLALYVSQDVGNELTNIYIVNPFTGEVRGQVGRGGFDVQDIDFRPNGQLRAIDRVFEAQVGGAVDRDSLADYIDIEPGTGVFSDVGDLGLETSYLDTIAAPAAAVAADDGFNVEAIAFAIIGGQERGIAVGNRATPPSWRQPYDVGTRFINQNNTGFPGFERPGPGYFTNVIYEFDEVGGGATSAPAADKMNAAIAFGAGTAIRDRGYIETFTLDATGNVVTQSSQLLAREVTTASSGLVPNFVISDGDVFIVEDAAGFQTRFEFDLGPQVLVSYDPANGLFISDGLQFDLDGTVFEFDTGNVIVIDAPTGNQLSDGSTVAIKNALGVEQVFEFDNDGSLNGAGNIAVPYTATTSQAGLVQTLAGVINAQSSGVRAEFNPNSNRISLVDASAVEPVVVTGTGVSVDGSVGVSAGAVRIPISEAATQREFVSAITEGVRGTASASFDSGRLNFSGATIGTFNDLVTAGIFTDLGTTGNVAAGNLGISVLAGDTAETVAARIVAAINSSGIPNLSASLNGDQIQLTGVVIANAGPLAQLGVAPGGIVTGVAVIGNTMYAVSDNGGLYRVDNPISLSAGNVATYVTDSYDLVGIQFSGLMEGPVHMQNGELSQILFGIDESGNLHAFDTNGRPQGIFANGATSVSTGLFNANGLTAPSLDFNLWHVSGQRGGDAGHGLPNTPNDSRVNITGGQSLYFGFQNPGANGVPDLSGNNATGLQNSYNFPGGAAGVLESAPFSLAGINAGDLPTLYFNYRFDTEQASSDRPLGNNANDYMRDSLRVYAAGEDGSWSLLATNNDPPPAGSNVGFFDDEFDGPLTGNFDVQPLFDNNGQFRQARVPLDLFAGQDDVRLRVEFSTNGSFGYGLPGGRGPEVRTIAGERLVDGERLVVNGQTFEIEMGPTLTVPGGSAISNGDSLLIDGTRFVFTDGSLAVVAPDVPVPFSTSQGADQIAASLLTAIQGAPISKPTLPSLGLSTESNDTIPAAALSGITGDSVIVVGSGEIGDNGALADPGEDVDMIRIDVDRGAQIVASIEASTIGSALDSYLRVFDAEGRILRDAFGNPIENNDFGGSLDSQVSFTAPATGTYYIGVSGAGNQTYNANVEGFATVGSTGDYNLTIDVERFRNPIAVGNRLQLEGAREVLLPPGSPLTSQGSLGTTGEPVLVMLDMTAAEVAIALQQSLSGFFAAGAPAAYPTSGNVVDLTGLVNYSTFDFLTGLPAPSVFDLDSGPFGATTNFIGDAFGAFNTGTNFDGTTNNGRPGALGAQNNDFEGVYLDDFIIGVAGRGEMVLRATSGDTTFVEDPQKALSNPDQDNVEILQGPYQFEIRGGQDYGVPLLAGFPVTIDLRDAAEIDSLTAPGISIRFNAAANMVAGDTFTVGDGTTVLTFEMDDVNDGLSVQPGNISVPFNSAVFNPINGSRMSESAELIAARVRDIINSSSIQQQLKVSVNLLNNDPTGATSDTVVLIGNASASVPVSIGEKIVSEAEGGANRERPQGQIVINATSVSRSSGFGVTVATAARDATTNASVPGSPRNTVTINTDRLAPGAVIMNSELLFNDAGGIQINGDAQATGVPEAVVPFIRLINNTVIGGSITAQTEEPPIIEGDQLFELGALSFADAVTSYTPDLAGGPVPIAGLDDPTQALGTPDYSGSGEPLVGEGVVSLGRGGQIVVEFTNNFLTGSGNADPDLMIFEVGDSEEIVVEVSADGNSFTNVGRASAASPKIDIDAFGFNVNSRLAFVRLTDVENQGAVTGDSVGADIDAVGAISSVAAEIAVPGGQGIVVANNATATLLNNVIVNSDVGIDVDASSTSTVVGGTVFQKNTANVAGSATLGQFPTVLSDNVPLFVSAAEGNLYPAPASPLIDSSIDSLQDRPSLVAVKRPLGIAASPLLAPEFDIRGQLRVDDPAVETPSGLGENVFKDRGTQDRADFVGPSVIIQNPIDNDVAGLDGNPDPTIVELTNTSLSYFDLQILDGLEPSDPARGTGVDNATVTSASILVFRNNQPLVDGVDYRFGYDSTNGVIRLTPLAGVWRSESVYTIRFVNSGESSIVADAGSTYTDGEQFTILDATGSTTVFEFDQGFLIDVPTTDGIKADVTDGTTFIVDDGGQRKTFEFDQNAAVTPGNVAVSIGQFPTVESTGQAIRSAIINSGIVATVNEISPGKLQMFGSRLSQFDVVDSGLSVTGQPGVQTVFGLQIPLQAGIPSGLADGQTFTIDRSGSPVGFELDTNGTVLPGNIAVQYPLGANADVIGAALVSAINGAGLGLSAAYDGNGLVRLGGDGNTRLDLTATALTQTGQAGQPAAVPIQIDNGAAAAAVASSIAAAIESQVLAGVTVTQFGSRLVLGGAQGVSGTGANKVSAILDLAGNALKPNQLDGSTTLTIFLGEGLDYGDAPAPYASTAAENGPRHTVVNGLSLGPTVTSDADAKLPDADLDDGLVFTSGVFAAFSSDAQITVNNTTGSTAYMSLWIDFNGDGFFAASERILSSQQVAQATTTVSFFVPASANIGDTFARVRLSTDPTAVASPLGMAPDGDVEDHRLTIQGNPYTNSSANMDVNDDNFISPIDVLQVITYLNDPTLPAALSLPAPGTPPYWDVNGDGFVTPLDALMIVNFLNSISPGGGEGEASNGELDAGFQTDVTTGNWVAGLDNGLSQRKQPQESLVTVNDMALIMTEDDEMHGLAESGLSASSGLGTDWVTAGWSDHSSASEGDDSVSPFDDIFDDLF